MKRISTFIIGIIVMSISIFSMGIKQKPDEKLEQAEKITQKIFNANKKENQGGEYYSAQYLKGEEDAEEYILVRSLAKGYMIFTSEDLTLIEYSDTCDSPYQGVEEDDAYYGGPANYYYATNGKIKNLQTNKTLNKEEFNKIAKKTKAKIKERKKNNGGEEKENEKQTQDTSVDPGPTGIEKIDANNYEVLSRKYIPNFRFFLNGLEHGKNIDGTCTSVATQILLAYNHWANDGRLIPANPKDGEVFLSDERIGKENDPYSKEWRETTSSDKRTDGVTSFYERIKQSINPYARSEGEKEDGVPEHEYNNGATIQKAYNFIQTYLSEYAREVVILGEGVDTSVDDLYGVHEASDVIALKNEVDDGYPAMASIDYYQKNKDTGEIEQSGHAIVVYGYQTIVYNGDNLDGVVAHMGWGDGASNRWVNADWVKGYLTFRPRHIHSDIEIDTSKHIYKCTTCTRTRQSLTHNYKPLKALEMNSPRYDTHHISRCECGKTSEDFHYFTYQAIDDVWHTKKCVCGYEGQDVHFNKTGNGCWDCGYKG